MPKSILNQVRLLAKAYDVYPQKSKGQNFLIDEQVLEDIVETANLQKTDVVLEIGPGFGILTEELVRESGQVVSIELDKKLYEFLKVQFINAKNLELINGDILKFNPADNKLLQPSYKIVANLPYGITSHFLKRFLTIDHKPSEMILLLQKEVAQRMCAGPGKLSLLGLSIQLYSNPEIKQIVKASSFWPVPAIDSSIVKLSSIKTQNQVDKYLDGLTEEKFWQVARIGFAARRKQLQNNLASGLRISSVDAKNILEKAEIDPKIRAQDLSVVDWIRLAKQV